jgi:hypothetical protein
MGQKLPLRRRFTTSVLPRIADSGRTSPMVRFVPNADYTAAICNGPVIFKLAPAIIPAPRRLTACQIAGSQR